jgi:hypothetical protein
VLKPGPYEHKPPLDDPLFERFEPNSGIRLAYVTGILKGHYFVLNTNDYCGIL